MSADYWDSQLKKLSGSVLPEKIKNILKVSFDALDMEEKETFLDICCFLIGEREQLAVMVGDGSGRSGLHNLRRLQDKCLIEVRLDELGMHNCITMHDHLRDMGREIANCGKYAYRLWSPEQIGDIAIEGKKGVLNRGIRAIRVETKEFYEECMGLVEHVRGSGKRFKRRLQIVIVSGGYFTEEIATLSAGPVWLRWYRFPHTALPPWLPLKNLRILQVQADATIKEPRSESADHPRQLRELIIQDAHQLHLQDARQLQELWSESGDPPRQLRELIIQDVPCFRGFPSSIGCLQHLKTLCLDEAKSVEVLPEEICELQSLETINFMFWSNLKSLPSKFGDLRNLRHLDLLGCERLRMLPASFKQLKNLQYINLNNCFNLTLEPDILENTTKLESLAIRGCKYEELPAQIANQQSLKELAVGSPSLMELPSNIGRLSELDYLEISMSSLKTFPPSMATLSSLTTLEIVMCPLLRDLDILSRCSLRSLKLMKVDDTGVSRISISQQCYPNLEEITLRDNQQLVEIDNLPISVKTVKIRECKRVKSISGVFGLVNLENLVLEDCEEEDCEQLKTIEGLECCRSLQTLVAHNWLIKSLENMESLRSVDLSVWKDISALRPCLQTLKKWPSEMTVCARTGRDLEAALKSLNFSGLRLVDFSRGWLRLTSNFSGLNLVDSNAAVMLCFVTNSVADDTRLMLFSTGNEASCQHRQEVSVKAGKWVWIGVFTQSSPLGRDTEFSVYKWDRLNQWGREMNIMPGNMLLAVEGMGVAMVGDKGGVVEAFYQLFQYLGN